MRIAIVNYSVSATETLRRVLSEVPGHEIVWTASDGHEAVDRCIADRPDLLLMDLMMPVLDGVATTRLIMQRAPCAILIVTATVLGHASQVFEALGAGALDAMNTPVLAKIDSGSSEALLQKIRQIGRTLKLRAARR